MNVSRIEVASSKKKMASIQPKKGHDKCAVQSGLANPSRGRFHCYSKPHISITAHANTPSPVARLPSALPGRLPARVGGASRCERSQRPFAAGCVVSSAAGPAALALVGSCVPV